MKRERDERSIRERILAMKGRTFIFEDDCLEVINVALDCGEDGDEVEIFTNTGRTLVFKESRMESVLSRFKPMNNAVIRIVDNRLKSVSMMNPDTMSELKSILMEQIRNVRQDPSKRNEAKTVINAVNSMLQLAKVELDYTKFMLSVKEKM